MLPQNKGDCELCLRGRIDAQLGRIKWGGAGNQDLGLLVNYLSVFTTRVLVTFYFQMQIST